MPPRSGSWPTFCPRPARHSSRRVGHHANGSSSQGTLKPIRWRRAVGILVGLTAQTSAAPPEQVELEDFFPGYADVEDGLAVFVNIGRDNVCEWADTGFAGPPPVDQTVLVQLKETGKGAVVASAQADLSVELWRFDPDVPPLVDPCPDTDAQDGPWATGTAHVEANDNDFDGSRTRTNSFGIRGPGNGRGRHRRDVALLLELPLPAHEGRRVRPAYRKVQPAPDRIAVNPRGRGTPLSAGVRHLAGPRRERVGVTFITPTQLADPACRHGVRISKETALDFFATGKSRA